MRIQKIKLINLKNIKIMSKHINYISISNTNSKSLEFNKLLLLAKSNDKSSKEKLIKQYYGLILHQCKGIFLNSYTFDDLVQTAILSFLKAIQSFDMTKGFSTFGSYVFWCIKNNFNYLCRQEIKHNHCCSLNIENKDGVESIDLIPCAATLEDTVLKRISYKNLHYSLNLLDEEELDLIGFLYLNCSKEKKPYLSNYSKLKNKDYYYCTILKKRTLQKLKSLTNQKIT